MLALCELLVETPEDLHDAEGGGAHGVGEVAARGGYRANDGDGTDALGVAEDLALATALVEGSEPRAQVGWVALVRVRVRVRIRVRVRVRVKVKVRVRVRIRVKVRVS